MVIKITVESAKRGSDGSAKCDIRIGNIFYRVSNEKLILRLEELNRDYRQEGGIRVVNKLGSGSEERGEVSEWAKDPTAYLIKRARIPETAYELEESLKKHPHPENLRAGIFVGGGYDLTVSRYCLRNLAQDRGIEGCVEGGVKQEDIERCYKDNVPCFLFCCSLPAEKGKEDKRIGYTERIKWLERQVKFFENKAENAELRAEGIDPAVHGRGSGRM